MKKIALISCIFYLFIGNVSCKKEANDPESADHRAVINTVQLTFTPQSGNEVSTFSYFDPDGTGGTAPQTQSIRLKSNETYTFEIDFFNMNDDGARTSLTEEIRKEAVSHLICFDFLVPTAGFGVEIADKDANLDPVGLTNTFWTTDKIVDDENYFIIELKHGISKVEFGPWCTYENVAVDIAATFSIFIEN